MYTCPKCLQNVFVETKQLIWHLREVHALSDSHNLTLICSQNGCPRTYHNFNSFLKHLSRDHCNMNSCPSVESGRTENIDIANQIDESRISNFGDNVQMSETEQVPQSSLSLTDCAAAFAARMYASANVTYTDVQKSITCTKEVIDRALGHLQEKTNTLLKNLAVPVDSTEVQTLMKDFESTRNMFSDIDTPFKLTKYFSDNFSFEKPAEVFLGHRLDSVRKNGKKSQVLVPVTCQYISIINTIKFLFSCDKMQNMYMQSCGGQGKMHDYCDGAHYSKHPLYRNHSNALQIQLYFDDFETTNPLGSKTKIHKMGAVYFALRNVPSENNSVLSNIHLCLLFNSVDKDIYGFERILEPLLTDLKEIEQNGIEVKILDKYQLLYGALCLLTADNLACHSLCGYVESFSANRFLSILFN